MLKERGILVATKGIKSATDENPVFMREVLKSLNRYNENDWGDMCEEDKQMNDNAVANGDDRIFAAYNTSEGKIFIITEYDRSATTVLFADEY